MDAWAKAIVEVSTDPRVAPYMEILDQEWVESLKEDAKITNKQMKIIEKISVEKSKIMKGIEWVKDKWDFAPKVGFAIVREGGKLVPWGSLFTDTTTSPEDIKPELDAAAAEEEKIEVATDVAKEKMDELQYEIDAMGVDKEEWKAFSRGRSKSVPEITVAAMINNYFDAHLADEWNGMSPAEKIGHKKLIDKYIDWAETTGDSRLLAKARALEIPAPASMGKANRPEANESIIALPTLGKLRVRIKK